MRKKGFTLIETLVAIAILTLAVAGPLLVASRALVSAQIAQEQLAASYLAQEGIEYVRMMRDDEYLAAYQAGGANVSLTAWSNFLSGSGPASIAQCVSTTCTLSPMSSPLSSQAAPPTSGALQPCGKNTSIACAPLYLELGSGTSDFFYTQTSSGTLTPYLRTIQAKALSSTEELITSTVSWSFHNHAYSVSIDEHLTPWQ